MFTVGRGLGRQSIRCLARLERLLETKWGTTPKLCIVGAVSGCGPQGPARCVWRRLFPPPSRWRTRAQVMQRGALNEPTGPEKWSIAIPRGDRHSSTKRYKTTPTEAPAQDPQSVPWGGKRKQSKGLGRRWQPDLYEFGQGRSEKNNGPRVMILLQTPTHFVFGTSASVGAKLCPSTADMADPPVPEHIPHPGRQQICECGPCRHRRAWRDTLPGSACNACVHVLAAAATCLAWPHWLRLLLEGISACRERDGRRKGCEEGDCA
jgi:hypothetical protein